MPLSCFRDRQIQIIVAFIYYVYIIIILSVIYEGSRMERVG